MCKLLLNAGYPASGTTSLYYTLWSNKYGHGGGVKEGNYLLHLQDPLKYKERDKLHRRKKEFGKHITRPWMLPVHFFKTNHAFDHRKVSIDKYINYYLDLWEDIKNQYQSVMDFSNTDEQLTEDFMMSIKDHLLKHFDIKVVMTLRDPIRRLWSYSNRISKCEGNTPQSIMEKHFHNSNLNYVEKYKKYIRVWGEEKVCVIINEEFYKGDTKTLSDFLNYDIRPTYNEINYLNDIKSKEYSQWCELDNDMWKYAYDNMKWIYDNYYEYFGFIPDAWIDAGFYK